MFIVQNGDSIPIDNVSAQVLEIKGEDVVLYSENGHEFSVRIDFDYELGEYMRLKLANYIKKPNGNTIRGKNVRTTKVHRLGIPCMIKGIGKQKIAKISNTKNSNTELNYTFEFPY